MEGGREEGEGVSKQMGEGGKVSVSFCWMSAVGSRGGGARRPMATLQGNDPAEESGDGC